uniref:Uncharacterized protein n=1 Tax=Salix viminalis TaxID=40686 RepID=A0A6N2N5K9_SALVM
MPTNTDYRCLTATTRSNQASNLHNHRLVEQITATNEGSHWVQPHESEGTWKLGTSILKTKGTARHIARLIRCYSNMGCFLLVFTFFEASPDSFFFLYYEYINRFFLTHLGAFPSLFREPLLDTS